MSEAVATAPPAPQPPPAFWPVVLVRFGGVAEVARFGLPDGLDVARGDRVVVESPRGQLVGDVLQRLARSPEPDAEEPSTSGAVLRLAGPEDVAHEPAEDLFAVWAGRIAEWSIDLELVDAERSLDGRTVLYVLNERGAEPTKLALRAVTENHGLIDVQPVTADGPVPPQGGGCGTCKH